MTYADRRAKVAALLAKHDQPALLVTHPVNVRYLTGLASSNAAALIRSDGSGVLATDARYAGTAEQLAADVDLVITRDVAYDLRELVGKVAVEGPHLAVSEFNRLGGELVPLDGLVESVRAVKDEGEIELLRRACAITDEAFAMVIGRVAPGVTEREVARWLDFRMMELGAERPAFETIVASGPNGAIPHHSPTTREIERGDLVTMDFGALVGGYHADMTRTVAVGEPAHWQRELYELVWQAQRAGRHAVRAENSAHDVDAAARDVIAAAGHADHFEHGLGHGVGLEIHELPFLGPDRTGRLEDRVPITVEPGVYLPGEGGVRIEDTLVTRSDGPELLTLTTKELLVI